MSLCYHYTGNITVTVTIILTVKPFGVILQCALERKLPSARRQVVKVCSEDDGVCFRELRVGARVEGW